MQHMSTDYLSAARLGPLCATPVRRPSCWRPLTPRSRVGCCEASQQRLAAARHIAAGGRPLTKTVNLALKHALRKVCRQQRDSRIPAVCAGTGFVFQPVTTWTSNLAELPLSVAGVRIFGVSCLYLGAALLFPRAIRSLVKLLRRRAEAPARKMQGQSTLEAIFLSVISALTRPLALYLPFTAALHCLYLLQLFLGVALDRMDLDSVPAGPLDATLDAVMVEGSWTRTIPEVFFLEAYSVVKQVTNATPKIAAVAFILFCVWYVLRWKEELVSVLVLRSRKLSVVGSNSMEENEDQTKFNQMLLPVTGLMSWVISIGGVLMIFNVIGINVQPLVAVGGLGGIVVGWSGQSIFSNVLSGITLFVTQPFIVGERVEMRNGVTGEAIVSGCVEAISPIYTTVRCDALLPVAVPNKQVADCIIINESRIQETVVEAEYNEPRQLSLQLTVEYKDMQRVGALIGNINQFLALDESVNNDLPFGASVEGLQGDCVIVQVVAHTTPAYANKFTLFKTRMIMDVVNILNRTLSRAVPGAGLTGGMQSNGVSMPMASSGLAAL